MQAIRMYRKARLARFGMTIAWVLAMVASSDARASSCGPRFATYYVECRSGQCEAEFRTLYTRAFGSCGKRLVVENVEADADAFLTSLVAAASPDNTGLWQVRLPLLTLDPTDSGIQAIKEELGQHITSEPPSSISAGDWLDLLDHWDRARWLVRVSSDASSATVAGARREAEGIARWEWWSKFADASFYWLSALVALVALVRTTRRFFFHLHNSSSDGRRRRLWACVLGQAAILGGCIAIAGAYRFDVWLGLLLVPGILLLWLVQAWAYLHVRWLSSPSG
jgi:hypothetical protein